MDFHPLTASAEGAPLKPASVDLVTVGQALHWFDFDRFYAEVRRVAKPGGILAAWTYPFFSAGTDVDSRITHFADQTVGPYWPAERRYVDSRYRDLPFPFPRFDAPKFSMSVDWTLEDVVGYFGTWSAVNRYRQENAEDPVAPFAELLQSRWGERRRVTWDLPMLVGRVE